MLACKFKWTESLTHMPSQARDTGQQMVIDNRWLIVAFGILILVCGGFFVSGFYLGKHQALQSAGPANPDGMIQDSRPQAIEKSTENKSGKKIAEDPSVRADLDWYKDVNKRAGGETAHLTVPDKNTSPAVPGGTGGIVKPTPSASTPTTAPAAAKETGSVRRVTYSVQVGAFRLLKEAEAKASLLKAKNYTSVIEPPDKPGGLFLLKVGKFESKADAVAMKLRLEKSGFTCFVKPK